MSPARIASCFGAATDRVHGLARIAKNEDVHVIVGDWMSEYNMTKRAAEKVFNTPGTVPYEQIFLRALEPALPDMARKGIKLACNAGASGTQLLAECVQKLVESKGLNLKVAWLEGDEVDIKLLSQNGGYTNLATGVGDLSSWPYKPIYAQCYLGAFGIATALSHGADIVICGRVADASPCMGAAIWHHSWKQTDYAQLAQSYVAGHLIECSTYVTGGNWTGFKIFGSDVRDFGYPIAEIEQDGQLIITMESNSKVNGMVTTDTCTSQLLYEIQGPLYFNSDVVANLTDIKFEPVGKNRVKVSGVKGSPPPPTTKLGITAFGGYQAEVHYYAVGLDIVEKAHMLETQIRTQLNEKDFSCLEFSINGSVADDPDCQNAATVDIRVFAQSPRKEPLEYENFLQVIFNDIMQTYPGATISLDVRQGLPKEYQEYFVTLIDQKKIKQRVHMLGDNLVVDVPHPSNTQTYPRLQDSYETSNPVSLESFGPTTKVPIGYIVHARSGDKGSNANVGFYVRNADEWDWLRSILTIDKIKQMLGKEYTGKPIQRFELPNIHAVHFLLVDHLGQGVSSSWTYDSLGKNVAEYLRCRHVDIPKKFLDRDRI